MTTRNVLPYLRVMKESFASRNRTVLLHTSFWLFYASYRIYDVQDFTGLNKAFVLVGIPLAFHIVASYVHYFFIFPVWLQKRKILLYVLLVTLLVGAVVPLRIGVENRVFINLTLNTNYFKTITLSRVISCIWDVLSFLFFTGMIRFTLDRFDLESKRKQLENEKLIAELNYLKAQINPHFLFNSLHNLNYLVYSGSKGATEVIIKLSNIMRYMIYDANKERVLLLRELDYMEDYIHLESIRLNNSFTMEFLKEGNLNDVEIAPLLLITILENAFKHGVKDSEQSCWIKASLQVTPEKILFNVRNRKLLSRERNLPSGFGLQNLKKRLVLSYPENHQLRIDDNEETYFIELTLDRS